MKDSILHSISSDCIDPVLNFTTEMQLAIVRLCDQVELSPVEQIELLRVSSILQKLGNFRMSNILNDLKNGKC